MLWFMRNTSENFLYITKERGEFQIGRQILPPDQSISRRHAVMWVQNDQLHIKDIGSRYGTYLNQGIDTNENIQAEQPVTLNNGDRIRFGMQSNIWIIDSINFQVTACDLPPEQTNELDTHVTKLDGHVTSTLTSDTTHITTPILKLTPRTFCALINGTRFVTLAYWQQTLASVQANQKLPAPESHLPALGDDALNLQAINFGYLPQRRTLFNNRVFLFTQLEAQTSLKRMIELAGGAVKTWDDVQPNDVVNENVCVVSPKLTPFAATQEYSLYEVFLHVLSNGGKRMIAHSEIAYAILYCDTGKHCNPNFSVSTDMLSLVYDEDEFPVETAPVVIVPETMCTEEVGDGSKKRPLEDASVDEVQEEVKRQKIDESIVSPDPPAPINTQSDTNALKRKAECDVVDESEPTKRAHLDNGVINGHDTAVKQEADDTLEDELTKFGKLFSNKIKVRTFPLPERRVFNHVVDNYATVNFKKFTKVQPRTRVDVNITFERYTVRMKAPVTPVMNGNDSTVNESMISENGVKDGDVSANGHDDAVALSHAGEMQVDVPVNGNVASNETENMAALHFSQDSMFPNSELVADSGV